jgi:DNA-binding response OmpR family regulator
MIGPAKQERHRGASWRSIRDVTILLIDDDRDLVAVLMLALQREGFAVSAARDAPTALALLDTERPDLLVLGVPLRGANALELLGQLRRHSRAVVIMLTGRGGEDDRVQGLELGADDYVSKPFSPRELVARIRAHLHHQERQAEQPPAALRLGPLRIDAVSHTATNAGQPLSLTVTEFRLLQYLMTHAGRVVPFATLLQQVWGYDDPSVTDVVRTTVYRLRRKLQDDPAEPHLLTSIAGVGFMLAGPAAGSAAEASGEPSAG